MANISLNIGLKALLTAQSALNNIGHNVTNANTPGYSRQSLHIRASRPMLLRGLSVGSGVQADTILRTVDDLLNRRWLSQISVLGRVDANLSGMKDFEARLGEPGAFGLSSLLDAAFTSISALASDPADPILRTGITQAMQGLSSRFHDLVADLGVLRRDAATRVGDLAGEANAIIERIHVLNQEVAKSEAAGIPANDMRDQRDLALRALGEIVSVTYHESPNGVVRVLAEGQLLVGTSSFNRLMVATDLEGGVRISVEGGTRAIEPKSGAMAGLVELGRNFLPGVGARLDQLAHNLVLEMNRVHSTGIPLGGGFKRLTGEFAIQDTDGDGALGDELLAAAGLPFDLTEGSLWVNVNDELAGTFTTHEVVIDPAHTRVSGFLAALNDIPGLSASLDSQGRVQLLAGTGRTFDFSAKLNGNPDVAGTFGGGRASLGTGLAGPFALSPSDTLTLDGGAGPFTVTFLPGDFANIGQATAAEVASVINAHPNTTLGGLRAVASGGRLFLQSVAEGSAASFDVVGGSALGTLGWSAGTTVTGHDTSVAVAIHGSYTGDSDGQYVFVPSGDGEIGTTPGLTVGVFTRSGQQVATLDVGSDYVPGTELSVGEGVSVSFSFGHLSATDNDAFTLDVIADSDGTDVLVALGLGSLFTGHDAATIALRADIAADPSRIAASGTGAEGDNTILLELLAVRDSDASALGMTLGEYYGKLVGDVGSDIATAENASEVEAFLVSSLAAQRDQVSGVNLDEELVNMIEFEQAYGAAAQFIQVVNTLNDELLAIL